jgi:polyferredoxin
MDEKKTEKINRGYIRIIRYAFQWGLFFFIIYGGYRFYLFVSHFTTGNTPLVKRPPLVEGFLPIGSLMALKIWLTEGIFDRIHPAGLMIFSAALLMSLLLKKSFCGWICPVGALSEALYRAGARLFGRNIGIHRYVDYTLRSLKYILLVFFLNIILLKMDSASVAAFMGTPYWKVADVKMLYFFTKMTTLTMAVLTVLVLLSLPFKNFWCRYLCPYGALVGLPSYLSPLKITRNENACIHCHRCVKSCPAQLPVEQKKRVRSPECTGCLTCVSNCPSRGALDMSLPARKAVNPLVYALLVATLFFGLVGAAKLTGHWHSSVTYDEYRTLVPMAEKFGHP